MPKKQLLIFNLMLIGILAGLALSLSPGVQRASAQSEGNQAILYFFWGNGCPHCAEAEPVLKDMAKRYPQMEVRAYEVWYNKENQNLFQKMGTAYGFTPSAVPGIFLGEKYWVGYTSDIGNEIEASVQTCIQDGCKDGGAGVLSGGVSEIWTSSSINSSIQNYLPWILGAAVIILGGLAYLIFRSRKKPVKSVRRHG